MATITAPAVFCMLKANGISKRYWTRKGWVTALDNVSLCLPETGRVALLGPSGSGKSTLGKILSLLLRPDSGTVVLDGAPVLRWRTKTPPALRRQVQLVWQSPRLAVDPRMRIKQIILEPMAVQNLVPVKRAERATVLGRWTERVGLTDELLDRYPHEISEGQLQRACLARALIVQPRYLICDELSSMLDVSTQASLLAAIRSEQDRRKLGVLLITHDRILAMHWCDSIATLSLSRILI